MQKVCNFSVKNLNKHMYKFHDKNKQRNEQKIIISRRFQIINGSYPVLLLEIKLNSNTYIKQQISDFTEFYSIFFYIN